MDERERERSFRQHGSEWWWSGQASPGARISISLSRVLESVTIQESAWYLYSL